jgi:hypothetical protein
MAPPPPADRRLAAVPAPLFGSAGPFAAPFAFPRPRLSAPAGFVGSGASASLCVDRREPPEAFAWSPPRVDPSLREDPDAPFSARTCREALRRVPPLSSYCDGLQLRPLTWGSRSRTWEYRRCSRSRRASPCAAAYLPPTLTRAFALPQRLASVCASDRSVKTCCIALASRVSAAA